MSEENKTIELLEEIRNLLQEINQRQITEEELSESNNLIS